MSSTRFKKVWFNPNVNPPDKWWNREIVTLRKARAKKNSIKQHKMIYEMQLEWMEHHSNVLEKHPNLRFIVDERIEAHRCDECHKPIYHGELYLEDKFIGDAENWDGKKFHIHRVCLECWKGPKFWL